MILRNLIVLEANSLNEIHVKSTNAQQSVYAIKGFCGYSSVVDRSKFRKSGQETTPQSLKAHTRKPLAGMLKDDITTDNNK